MRKVLITGIAGFAGSHLAERLVSRCEVWGLYIDANFSNLEGIKGLNLVECDMTDYAKLSSVVEKLKPHSVYHLAGQSLPSLSFKHPGETLRTNIFSTLNLFEAIAAFSPQTIVLNIGSADEYGEVDEADLPVNEKTELRPLNPYAVSKVTQDLLAFQYSKSKGLKIVRARPFNHIGPRQAPTFVASEFAKRIAELESGATDNNVLTVGNLEVAKDFLDVRDVVAAYELLVEKGAPGEVYNICSGSATRIRDIADKLISLSTSKVELARDPSKNRPTDTLAIYGDNTKLRSLGWAPERGLEETLKDLLDYWRARAGSRS